MAQQRGGGFLALRFILAYIFIAEMMLPAWSYAEKLYNQV